MKSAKKPRLIAISGPVTSAVYFLDKDLDYGRDPCNAVCIDDETLSDVHMTTRPENGHTLLVDRNSRNGILINGEFYLEKILEHGDRIKCGATIFLYWEEEGDPDTTAIIEEELERRRRWETLRVDYSSRDELASFYRKISKIFVGLVAMLKSISDIEQVQARVLAFAFEVIPARRAVILLNGSNCTADDFVARFYREREDEEPVPFTENGKLVRRVYKDRSGHLDNEVPAICVPLIVNGGMRGIIYMEGGDRGTVFEHEDLLYLGGIADAFVTAMNLSRDIAANRAEREILRAQVPAADRPIVGETAAMQSIFSEIKRAAQTNSPVLITGESGTGKELVARAIHAQSSRRDKPFVALNCAGLSDGMVQSELFGHEKGAFTGAVGSRKGRILSAEGGTLFFDEIGDLKLEMQGLLLRFLQEGTFEPLGSDKTLQANVRIIAATNVDLPQAIAAREFREDLHHRLDVFPIRTPALRERIEDIPVLAKHFLATYGASRGFTEISVEAVDALRLYDWPGNVRELENAIRYAVDHGDPSTLDAAALQAHLTKALEQITKADKPIDAMTKIVIERALERNGGDAKAAATALGISVSQLYRNLNPDSK